MNIPETLWGDIEKAAYYPDEDTGATYATINLNSLEEILEKYFGQDSVY